MYSRSQEACPNGPFYSLHAVKPGCPTRTCCWDSKWRSGCKLGRENADGRYFLKPSAAFRAGTRAALLIQSGYKIEVRYHSPINMKDFGTSKVAWSRPVITHQDMREGVE